MFFQEQNRENFTKVRLFLIRNNHSLQVPQKFYTEFYLIYGCIVCTYFTHNMNWVCNTIAIVMDPQYLSGGRVKRCMFFCSLCFNEVDGYQEDVIDSDYKGN